MPDTTSRIQQRRLTARLVTVQPQGRPTTLREDDRSVEFIAATEIPARVYDWERGVVDEVLLVDGIEIPANRQVPFLDSHDHGTVEAVLGSMRDFRKEGGELIGRSFFSKKQKAFDAWRDVADGHITDVSVGYEVTEATWVPEGERAVVAGREYRGPVKVSTRSRLIEVSLTPIGADSAAKVRSADQPTGNTAPAAEARGSESKQEGNPMPEIKEPITTPSAPPTPPVDLEATKRAAIETERKRVTEISEVCRTVGADDMIAGLVERGVSVEQAIREVHAKVAERLKPVQAPSIKHVADDGEKFRAAASDAMTLRSVTGASTIIRSPAAGSDNLARISFRSLMEECIRRNGKNPAWMTADDMVRELLGRRSAIVPLGTADFTSILANVSNKAAMIGYQTAPATWRTWCRTGSLPDFKASKRVVLSDAPDLLATPELGEVKFGKMSDTNEAITLVTYARRLGISRQALVNDDLGLFNGIFRAFGARAGNLVNSLPYAVLIANANLTDTGALFNTTAVTSTGGHANQASTGAAPSSTTVSTGEAAMFAQVAPEGSKLNIAPKFLLCGAANKFNAEVVLGSQSLPVVDMASGVKNPFFNVIIPIADANITGTKWYLVADPNMHDTVEVAFLDGRQEPTLVEKESSEVLGTEYWCYIDAVAKALDFRGMYYNAGA